MEFKKLSYYLTKSKIIKPHENLKKIRLSFLGSYSLNGFEETIKVLCNEENISCSTYVGGYNQFFQEIFDENSGWHKFESDITFLMLDSKKILGELYYYPYDLSIDQRKKFINEKFNELKKLIEIVNLKSKSRLVISNFLIPTFSPFGIYEYKTEYGLKEMLIDLNQKLLDYSRELDYVFIFDFNSFVTKFGENQIFDYKKIFSGDLQISFNYIPILVNEFLSYIKPVLGLTKKCIVLDLDNTIWGGIVGEDGFNGIKLGPDPLGQPFVELQKILKSFSKRGVILAINSKNNFDDAMKVITEHPYMELRKDDFSSIRINWNDKISNIKEISSELNIGLDSIIFVDDDPSNRELIKTALPKVKVIDLPDDPSQYPKILRELDDFHLLKITNDDFHRIEMYSQQQKRNTLMENSTNIDEFLKKLNIKVKLCKANTFAIPRISQLTIKTNQFNLTTKRYQEKDIKDLIDDSNIFLGYAEVSDKFGNNGITNVFIFKTNGSDWYLDTFLLSCRIMGKKIENLILGKLLEYAKNKGAKKIIAEYIPTEKNKPIEDFLFLNGFEKEKEHWIFTYNKPIKIPEFIEVEMFE